MILKVAVTHLLLVISSFCFAQEVTSSIFTGQTSLVLFAQSLPENTTIQARPVTHRPSVKPEQPSVTIRERPRSPTNRNPNSSRTKVVVGKGGDVATQVCGGLIEITNKSGKCNEKEYDKDFLNFLQTDGLGLLILSSTGFAEGWFSLSTYSFHNNKTISVDDTSGNNKGIKVMVKAVNRDEPAGSPMYLSTGIQCPGEKKINAIDLGSFLKSRYGDKVIEFLGKSSKSYPSGQVHVCSLENVNFDKSLLFVSVLKAGSDGCDQSKVIDFIFPIKDLCR